MASATSGLTVGEVTARAGLPRAMVCVVVIHMPPLLIVASLVAANHVYDTLPDHFTTNGPWWMIMTWGFYAALVLAVAVFVNLCVPRAPFALVKDIFDVGLVYIGIPLLVVVMAVVLYGQAWMLVVLACVLADLIAGVLALWGWIIRKYCN